MDVWRICRSKHESTAFSGMGAEKLGGRWNPKGIAMVYTSQNLSLAALELFVHVSPGIMPTDLISICGSLPESVSRIELAESKLPSNWRAYPAPHELRDIGEEWLQSKSSLALIVPSAINPVEKNVLLNPQHGEFKKLKSRMSQPFYFDPRMFGK